MQGQLNRRPMWHRMLGSLVALAVMSGCSDDSSGSTSGNGTVPNNEPLYVIQTLLFSDGLANRTDYLKFAPGLTADAKVDESRTIELNDENSTIWASNKPGEFFLSRSSTGQIVRYLATSDGKIEEAESISFSAYGVNQFYYAGVVIESDTKAYLFDEITLQGFVWDPSSMTIVSNVDLTSRFHAEEGGQRWPVWRSQAHVRAGNKIMFAFQYLDQVSTTGLPRSGMLVINTETDTFSVVEHPTCGGLYHHALGPDGMVYAATGGLYAIAHYSGAPGLTPPCMVRFDPEKETFDESFLVELSTLTGGKPTGGFAQQSGKGAYLRAANVDLLPAGDTRPVGRALAFSPIWETYFLEDMTKPEAATFIDLPIPSNPLGGQTVNDVAYVSDVDLKINQSILLDMSTNPPTPGLVGEGWLANIRRVR